MLSGKRKSQGASRERLSMAQIVVAGFVVGALSNLSRRLARSLRSTGTESSFGNTSWHLNFGVIHNQPPPQIMMALAQQQEESPTSESGFSETPNCGLCGEDMEHEPNSPAYEMAMRLRTSLPDTVPVQIASSVHLRCARKVIDGLQNDKALWEIE